MKGGLIAFVILVAGCRSSGDATTTPTATPDASGVVATLTSASSDYRAAFGSDGRIAAPMIPLVLVVKNGGQTPWKCDGAISVSADGERGKSSATRSFLTTLSPCELAPGAEHREELEAGEFLTEVSGRHVKGDRLAVRACLAPSPASEPVAIDVFVPEG